VQSRLDDRITFGVVFVRSDAADKRRANDGEQDGDPETIRIM
jgi:hypothetical protein